MLPDVPALDRAFDYLIPPALVDDVRIGTIVRVPLHGRRVRGWVVALDVDAPQGVELKPVAKVTGWGPDEELVRLSKWAAWRWAGRPQHFLGTASPDRAVRGLPPPAGDRPPAAFVADPLAVAALDAGGGVVRLPPAADLFGVVAAAASHGPALVVVPSAADATRLATRLGRAGVVVARHPQDWARAAAGGATVVGTRAAAWAPAPDVAAAVVLDVHDEALQEERSPTWHARDVVVERARRRGIPWVVTSPVPPADVLGLGPLFEPSRADERDGWARLDVIDRRGDDPRSGHFSPALAPLLSRPGRAVCVLNRKGRARLLACAGCGELGRCESCGGAVSQTESGSGLRCRACELERPMVCGSCGGQRLKLLRVGVTRMAEELAALVGEPVGEVTAETDSLPDTRVLAGTEAVLHRVSGERVGSVAFLDFDQELLAPHFRADEAALTLLARASRLVGGRSGDGRVLVQTRIPDHPVLAAARHGDPARLVPDELDRRQALRYPPFAALAVVSGDSADAFVAALDRDLVEARGPVDGRWLLRAADHGRLCTALARTPRPPGRLRVEVDPPRP